MTTKKRAFSTRNTGNVSAAQRRSAENRRCKVCDRKSAVVRGDREWLDENTLLVAQGCRFCEADLSYTITLDRLSQNAPLRTSDSAE